MEFIEKLYSNELFAPILFTVVGILALLFIIVLILALRDAKKSKNDVVEVAKSDDEATVIEEAKDDIEEKEEVNELSNEEEKKEEVVDNIVLESDSFEEVKIDAPEASKEDDSIKIENEEVASIELERAENDLDEIAATLLKEYQKEKNDDEEVIETPQVVEKQFSPVFVTPDTLPNKVEEEKTSPVEMPILSDIPVPQPVRVVQTSQIIDSSKKENVSINDIETEEYSIKR